VQLGEQSGKLVENMRVAAGQEEKQRVFRSKVRSALIYPTFVMSLTVIVGLGVAWFLLPRLGDTFSQLDVSLPFISKIFLGFGTFLKANGLWFVPTVITAMLLSIYLLFAAPKTKMIGQAILFHVPGISKLMREVEIARFGYLLGTLLGAGLSVTQALDLMQRATAARRYRKLYAYLQQAFEDGYSFRTSLPKYAKTRALLPPAVQQMIIAGERSGALPETLTNVGAIYEQKADVSTQNLEAMLEPILLIIVWIGVMGVAVAVILPIYSLVGGLEAGGTGAQ
jgi:type IV pilus assembly protein PilC